MGQQHSLSFLTKHLRLGVVNLQVIKAWRLNLFRHPLILTQLIVLPIYLVLVQRYYNDLNNLLFFRAQLHNDGNKVFLNDFIQKQPFSQGFLSLIYGIILGIDVHYKFLFYLQDKF